MRQALQTKVILHQLTNLTKNIVIQLMSYKLAKITITYIVMK